MAVMGLQCEKNRILWAVVEGNTRSTATVMECGARPLPKKSRQERLHWIYQEITEMVASHTPESIYLCEAEAGQSMRASILEHAQMDGVVLAAAESSKQAVTSYKWQTLRSRYKAGSKDQILALIREMPLSSGIPKNRLVPIVVALAELPE